jgi:predicted nucleotidyltransferase
MTEPRKIAERLAADLVKALGESLHGVTLFGSVARGEFVEGVSNINVLVLVDDIDPAVLRRVAPLAEPRAADGLAPLLMEDDEWRRASDVFAIELLDMRDAHEVLHGRDPIEEVASDGGTLRLQAERELRSKLLLLRTGLMRTASAPQATGALLIAALPSFLTYLRAALRLADRPVPARSAELIEAGTALVGADPGGFVAALEARTGLSEWKIGIDDAVVGSYNNAAERTAAFVDTLTR